MPLLADKEALREAVDRIAEWASRSSRTSCSARRRAATSPAGRSPAGWAAASSRRGKPGKLPWRTVAAKYALEYGFDSLEVHADAIVTGQRVLIHDDVLATGGTAKATVELVEQLGGEVVGLPFIIELEFLQRPRAARRLRSLFADSSTELSARPCALPITRAVMYDALTTRYTFACPQRGETRVALSSFRRLERFPDRRTRPSTASRSTAVRRASTRARRRTTSSTGRRSASTRGAFSNLMTSRLAPVEDELGDLAARRIQAGEWPWSFFCYPEGRPRPVFPSSFFLLAPAEGGESGSGWRSAAPSAERTRSTSSRRARRRALPQRPPDRRRRARLRRRCDRAVEEFAAELYSARFDSRRLDLH